MALSSDDNPMGLEIHTIFRESHIVSYVFKNDGESQGSKAKHMIHIFDDVLFLQNGNSIGPR